MRKITFTLLSIFFVLPCMANIHINPDAVTEVVAKHFPNKQVECIREYNTQLKASNGSGIAASKLWNVCAAGGLDVKQPADKEKCRTFVKELTSKGTVKFYEVCGKDKSMVEKGTGRCIDDVFSNKILGGVKVNMLIATGLSKEYARVKYNDNSLMCSKTARKTTVPPDDYVRCASLNKNMTYEFKFDSVTSTTDYVIDEGTESGICKIYDVKYTPSGSKQATYLGNGQKVGDYESWPSACETTDAAKCSKINETMQKFGRTAKIGSTGSKGNKRSACIINKDAISPSNLRTAFGIDNYVFKKGGVQLNATSAVKDQVCAYVRQAVKSPAITSCVCNDGFVHIYDFSGMITETDDVLTCKINNKTVDFVFDDLTEHNKKIAAGGSQGMDCMAAGGTYAGQQCMYLDEKQCKLLAKANLKNCPTCKKVEYKNGVCQLPSGADAIQVQKNTRLAIIVGGAVVGVVVTVATAGTAGAPVTAVVFTLVETGGAVMEYNAQVKIDGIADEFLLTSIKCKSASCAEKLVKENLQRLSNIANDMQTPERNAVDKELARLVGLLPDDSQLFIDILGGESLTEANHKPLFDADSWEPEQVWRAVGVALQMTSVFASVGKWVLTKAGLLSETLPEATIQLTKKAKISRVKLEKAASEGKKIKTSDGKYIDEALKLKKPTMTLPDFLQSIDNVRQVKTKTSRSAVYEFRNAKTGRKYFLKYNSDAKEIERTKRAYEVLKNSNVTSGVNIVETDGDVIRSFAKLHNIDIPDGRTAFIMENAIEQSDMMTLNDLIWGNFENALPQLGNKALTVKEQELILEDIKRLNNAGIKHGDLPQNMYIYRDSSGKIRVSIIDYESWATDGIGNKDIEDIERYFSNMQKGGLAKSKTDDVITKPLSYYVEGLDKISDNEDLLFNIKIIGDRQGTSIYERRPVIKNILEKNGLKYGSSSDLNAWYIRQSEADGQYELWSPIMKGKDAKEVMPKLIRDLDNADISSNLVVPIKAQDFLGNFHTNSYQALSNEERWRLITLGEEQKHAGVSLSDRVNGYPNIYHSLDEIQEKYPKDKFLFKGATSSDDYMAFSARSGRSGTVYATPDVKYAQIYDGLAEKYSTGMSATGDKYVSNAFDGDIDNGYVRVGFINVYEQSPNNVYYKNFGMESYRGEFERKIASKDAYQAETYITPEENPLVEKILHIRVENKAKNTVEDFYVPVKDQTNETVKSAIDKVINNRKADPSDTYEGPVYNRLKSQKQALDDNK